MGNTPPAPATPQPSVSPSVSPAPSAPTFSPAPTGSPAPTVGWARVGDGLCAGSEVAEGLGATTFSVSKSDPAKCYNFCNSRVQDKIISDKR